jgi:hypothetical protein
MALPHYKLHTLDKSVPLEPSSFPVILVPADPPQKTERLRNALRSKKLLTTFAILAVVASATLLWLLLEPGNKPPNPRYLIMLGGVAGFSLLYFLLAALLGRNAEAPLPTATAHEFALLTPRESIKADATPSQVEICCEEWSSEPFTEIMDESVMAEVFNDEMIAPDHLIFSFKVEE